MRILVFEAAAREQHAGIDQRLDHGFVGVTLFTLVGEHALADEARCVIGEAPIGVDGVGDRGVDAPRGKLRSIPGPDLEVLAAVTGCGVHEAGADVVGDMVAGEQRHGEIIPGVERLERMISNQLSPSPPQQRRLVYCRR